MPSRLGNDTVHSRNQRVREPWTAAGENAKNRSAGADRSLISAGNTSPSDLTSLISSSIDLPERKSISLHTPFDDSFNFQPLNSFKFSNTVLHARVCVCVYMYRIVIISTEINFSIKWKLGKSYRNDIYATSLKQCNFERTRVMFSIETTDFNSFL